jgi:hypothetical protein
MIRSTTTTLTDFSRRSSSIRRLRRSHGLTHRQLCGTHGCTTRLVVDAVTSAAACPVCGFERRTN